ncbi:MAG: shikimate dehydrogenase [Pseudomonadales bacterium]|nr:shikimate dehydrogenase [Pseudomonadales bacterium]
MTRYAVIGTPISHSKSPLIHRLFAEQTNQDVQYEAIEVQADDFDSFVTDFFAANGGGLNVTVPHKERAHKIAQLLAPNAKLAGAVNTLYLNKENVLCGDNTDGRGLVRDIQNNHEIQIAGKRVLVIGAGGAVRGALVALIDAKPATLTIVNRTLEKAEQLRLIFEIQLAIETSSFEQLDGEFDLVINGTSLGLSGETPPILASHLSPNACCYDMMYGNEDTAFVAWAKNNGAVKALDGLGMLVEQAAESFLLWRGVRPETEPVISKLRNQ